VCVCVCVCALLRSFLDLRDSQAGQLFEAALVDEEATRVTRLLARQRK
jgi:hypothetical protein